MLNGQLSNRQAPSFLFRVDNFLVKSQDSTLRDKVLNKIVGESRRAKIDPTVAQEIRSIFRNTDYTVGLAVMKSEWVKYPNKLKEELINLPITDIYLVIDHFDICSKLLNGEFLYYVDDNESEYSLVGHHACINLKELDQTIKGGYVFNEYY